MAEGKLPTTTETTDFDGIPEGLDRLAHGAVRGRLVAVFGD